MGKKLTGVNASVASFGVGLTWENTPSNKTTAMEIIRVLEDRRVLFGVRMWEDQRYCIRSAIEVRHIITELLRREQLSNGVETSLRAMRAAFRRFVDEGGPDGAAYYDRGNPSLDPFSLALGALREAVGTQVALLAYHYGIEVEYDLAAILPTDIADDDGDAGWMPGFDR
jgi:hypothetical protein